MRLRRRKHLILVVSGKGGVGKSTTSRLLAETLRARFPGVALWDGNAEVGQLLQYCGARGKDSKLLVPQPEEGGVRFFNLHGDERDRDDLVNLLASDAELCLCDLPAESLPMLDRLRRELAFFDLVREYGWELTLVSPVTPYRASIRDIADTLALAPDAQHVIVRNLGFGEPENTERGDKGDFRLWNESNARKRAIELGAMLVDLPRCKSGILAAIDDQSLSFADALKSPVLDIADRQRLAVWLKSANAALEPLFKSLIQPEEVVA